MSVLERAKKYAGYVERFCVRTAEKVFVAAVEYTDRAACFLNPRTHRMSWRLDRIAFGAPMKDGKKFAVLVLYAESEIPPFTQSLIDALTASPFNLVIISNGAGRFCRDRLLAKAQVLIERKNIGRDFGAYKDGIQFISDRFGTPRRLIIANDSLYYFGDGLKQLIVDLDRDEDFIGVSEVHEFYYHVASFMLSFGERVLQHPNFQDFWKRYRPVSTRSWAILNGEKALTRVLLDAGFSPFVLFKTEYLRSALSQRSPEALLRDISLLPARSRASVNAQIQKRSFEGAADISDEIVGAISSRNQMHTGGLLFCRDLGLPMIKRDLIFREIYKIDELAAALPALDLQYLQQILDDLNSRKSHELKGWQRVLHRHGAI